GTLGDGENDRSAARARGDHRSADTATHPFVDQGGGERGVGGGDRRRIGHTSETTGTVKFVHHPLTVDIWSDVVCPWCYIGKRKFEAALDELAGDVEVDVRYHAYQLDPHAPPGSAQPVSEVYASKF